MRNELQKQYGSLFEEWKIDLMVSRLSEMGIPQDLWPDMMQQLAMELLKFQYDPDNPGQAGEKTVLFSFITLELQHLRRKRCRQQLRHEKYANINGPDDSAMEYSIHPTDFPYSDDIQPVVGTLGDFEKRVCDGLAKGLTKNEIAKKLDCNWRTVHKAVGRIRNHFRSNGIDGWVE